jgi:O-succinylbenzoic acid--CoA ligase
MWELRSEKMATEWLGDLGKDVYAIAYIKKQEWSKNLPKKILISTHSSAAEFIAEFIVGCGLEIPLFLCNPNWGIKEWQQVNELIDRVELPRDRGKIMIPTGGSSGQIKFATHTWQTLSASVRGFCQFYGVERINSFCTLPLYHVSGLMQLMRSFLTDGRLQIASFKEVCNLAPRIDSQTYFISLVPTQLEKLLSLYPQWLAGFQTILLGGAPPDRALLDAARSHGLPIALTYGMTETASQITSVKPPEFLAGNFSCGRILPHAKIEILNDNNNSAEAGAITIKSKSLMLGYFPNIEPDFHYLHTDDIGYIDTEGYLTIIGRNSGKIITGGENVFPQEVIQAILDTRLVKDVWVLGLADRYWGEVVTAVYVPIDANVSEDKLIHAIAPQLSKYKIPKYWIPVAELPRNSVGKINLDFLRELAIAAVKTQV